MPLALSFLYTRTRTRTHSLSLLGLSLWRSPTDEPTSHPTSPTTLGSRSNSESAAGLPGRERRSRVTGTEDQGGAGAGPGAEAGDMPSRRKPQRGALSVQVQNGPQNQTATRRKTEQHNTNFGQEISSSGKGYINNPTKKSYQMVKSFFSFLLIGI